RASVPASSAIASVVVDRTLEMVGSAPFALCYAALLLRRGVPELEGALVTVGTGVGALAVGVALAVRRLRKRSGLVTAAARATGLDWLRVVRGRMDVLARAEDDASRLVRQPRRLARALAVGVGVNLVVLAEYRLLLAAFGLPHDPLAVVAAVFATGAAHSLPVPAAVHVHAVADAGPVVCARLEGEAGAEIGDANGTVDRRAGAVGVDDLDPAASRRQQCPAVARGVVAVGDGPREVVAEVHERLVG